MSAARSAILCGLLCSPFAMAAYGQTEAPTTIFEKLKGTINWADLLTDNAPGAISASNMLGINGDSVTNVENVRDVVVAVKGLSANGSDATFGLSITPARTSLSPMDLSTYASGTLWRLLGATTFGYAQGDASIEGQAFERRAMSIETSFFWHEADDPVLAYAFAIRDGMKSGSGPCAVFEPARPSAPAKPKTPAVSEEVEDPVARPGVVTGPAADSVRKRAADCKDSVIKALRWNRSQSFASFATGWIKPSDGSSSQESLGRTAVLGLNYGFDNVDFLNLKERAALSVSYRKTWQEPVLSTLVTGPVVDKDTSLLVGRLTGGSDRFRALLEGSNAKAGDGVTPSQRAFKAALGVDVRLPYEGLWISLRVGKQQTVTGDSTEVGSLLNISYSPTALLSGK
jgi:hypothetical protein